MTERSRVAPVSSRRKAVGTALQPRGSRRTGSASPSAQTLPLLRNLWAPLLSPTPTWPFSILCPSPTLHPELIPSEGPSDRALSRGSLTWLVSRVHGPRLLRKHPSLPHSRAPARSGLLSSRWSPRFLSSTSSYTPADATCGRICHPVLLEITLPVGLGLAFFTALSVFMWRFKEIKNYSSMMILISP